MNQEREARGLSPLAENDMLMDAAEIRADEILGHFAHTRPDGRSCFTAVEEEGYSFSAVGENIAKRYTTPEEVMDGWMHSEGHKANILKDNFKEIGVGVSKADYGFGWVQFFGTQMY